jgi:hypothetical protein
VARAPLRTSGLLNARTFNARTSAGIVCNFTSSITVLWFTATVQFQHSTSQPLGSTTESSHQCIIRSLAWCTAVTSAVSQYSLRPNHGIECM